MKFYILFIIFFKQNGFLSALPHLCLWFFSIPWGWFADYLIRSGKLSLPSVRKLSNNVGMLGPSFGLLCLAFAGCDNILTIASLCFSCALYGALYSGYQVQIRIKLQIQYQIMSFYSKVILLESKYVILFSIIT